MKQIVQENLLYYQFASWSGVKHGVFTRKGGVSNAPWASLNLGGNVGDEATSVRRNHEILYEAMKMKSERACTVWQVHSADIVIVLGPIRGRRWLTLADAMITDQADTPLAMRFADCVPLLFYDSTQGVIAIAHAGWRGTVQGIGANTVRTMMQAYGCKPANIHAGIGPSIGPEKYQVGQEVVAAIQDYFGTLDGLVRYDPHDGSSYLDLWEANKRDLEHAGIEQIEVARICTAQNTHEFYSHRAEKGRTGRFGAVISL